VLEGVNVPLLRFMALQAAYIGPEMFAVTPLLVNVDVNLLAFLFIAR